MIHGVDPDELHSSARRYLVERQHEIGRRYVAPQAADRRRRVAKDFSPRRGVVDAILVEVERLDPDRLPDVPTLLDVFQSAADTARPSYVESPISAAEVNAISDERERFRAAVDVFRSEDRVSGRRMPYRRVLTPDESSHWRARLQEQWGMEGLIWHPMLPVPTPPDVLVLREEAMWHKKYVGHVRRALRDLGDLRVVELREDGPEYLLEIDLLTPVYNGEEGVWTAADVGWIAYASYDGTLAFGGTITTALKTTWPDLDDWK